MMYDDSENILVGICLFFITSIFLLIVWLFGSIEDKKVVYEKELEEHYWLVVEYDEARNIINYWKAVRPPYDPLGDSDIAFVDEFGGFHEMQGNFVKYKIKKNIWYPRSKEVLGSAYKES